MGYDVGDAIRLTFTVRDEDGELVNADTVVLTVTKPDLTTTTPTVDNPPATTGEYEATYLFAAAGRHTFWWASTNPAIGEDAGEFWVTGLTALPTLQQVKDYLDSSQTGLSATFSDAVITEALNAEMAAQRDRCRIGTYYSPALSEALKRRVQRNLAMRGLPVAVLQGDADTGSAIYLPGDDPEVRRLERPYRRMVVG